MDHIPSCPPSITLSLPFSLYNSVLSYGFHPLIFLKPTVLTLLEHWLDPNWILHLCHLSWIGLFPNCFCPPHLFLILPCAMKLRCNIKVYVLMRFTPLLAGWHWQRSFLHTDLIHCNKCISIFWNPYGCFWENSHFFQSSEISRQIKYEPTCGNYSLTHCFPIAILLKSLWCSSLNFIIFSTFNRLLLHAHRSRDFQRDSYNRKPLDVFELCFFLFCFVFCHFLF